MGGTFTARRGHQEVHPVQRIAYTGFSRFRIGFLLVGALMALEAGAQTPAVQKGNGPPPPPSPVTFSKSFAPDTIGPGSVSTLTFTIENDDPSATGVTDLDFTDVLPAGMIATPASATTTCVDGIVTAVGTTISLTNGRLGAGDTCTVTVNVTATATVENVSGDLTSSAGNSGTATATLTVDTGLPGFSKSFSPSSIPPGGTSTLTFTIDNGANSSFVFMAFTDSLPTDMVIATPSNASSTCLSPSLTADPETGVIFFNAALGAESSCTVTVDVITTTTGVFVNTSGELVINFSDTPPVTGGPTAVLNVPADFLIKSFTDDPVPPGGTVTLEFTINNPSRDEATSIAFDDDLEATLSGLEATVLPAAGAACISPPVPGIPGISPPLPGVSTGTITGTSLLSFTGGSLPAERSCMISVTLLVPPAASPGSFPNTTTAITVTIDGVGVTGNMATDNLVVGAPRLTKEFLDATTFDPDPVVGAGDDVILRFTITNTSTAFGATDIAFEDVFDVVLPTASSVPGTVCNGGTATFTALVNPPGGDESPVIPATLTVSGGSLAASADCTFDITLDVAEGAPAGTYPNTTSAITATVDGETVAGNSASDDLVVVAGPTLSKEFTDDPVAPGDTVTLEFTLTHAANAAGDATGIMFTDDLALILPGTPDVTVVASAARHQRLRRRLDDQQPHPHHPLVHRGVPHGRAPPAGRVVYVQRYSAGAGRGSPRNLHQRHEFGRGDRARCDDDREHRLRRSHDHGFELYQGVHRRSRHPWWHRDPPVHPR